MQSHGTWRTALTGCLSAHFPSDRGKLGPTGSGHVCITFDNPTEEILQLEARSRGRGSGCLQSGLDHLPGEGLYIYANPPGNLVGRVLNGEHQQQITLVLVVSAWKSQPWYPVLLERLIDSSVLPQRIDTICCPTHPGCVPELMPQLYNWGEPERAPHRCSLVCAVLSACCVRVLSAAFADCAKMDRMWALAISTTTVP